MLADGLGCDARLVDGIWCAVAGSMDAMLVWSMVYAMLLLTRSMRYDAYQCLKICLKRKER